MTTQEDVRKFFQALTAARVVIEVGTHSAWVQDVITEWGHEVLVANPRLMEGSKRRKRKSDRIAYRCGTELINTTRGLVKSMGTRLPRCSSPSFAQKVKDAIPVEVREALLPLGKAVGVCDEGTERAGATCR